ncbi:CEN-like protein 1 [Gigantopelta aegis]|uniref:CEN-like protein 1 n=1 Tax=Gigantopelta aegis TaxID=1735272 RepID=UPI001B888100|nr:CEN-like protein 1 [Gigantopelta aegis]
MVDMEMTMSKPVVKYSSAVSNYRYVLLMIDPDAPFPCAPPGVTISDHIHYAAVVRAINQILLPVDILIDYHSPHPSIGIHRYQIYLFDWSPGRQLVMHNDPDNRTLFNMDVFRSDNNLNGPITAFQFRVMRS